MTTPRTQQSEQSAGTGGGTPRTTAIIECLQVAINADNREQSIAYREEAGRQIEDLETELAAALRSVTELEKESQSWKDAHGVAAFDRSQLEVKLHETEQALVAMIRRHDDKETKLHEIDVETSLCSPEQKTICNRIQEIIHPTKL